MKKYVFEADGRLFYSDQTYRCYHWPIDDFTKWYIEDDKFYFCHRNYTEFISVRIDTETMSDIKKKWNDFIDSEFEKNFLENQLVGD